MQKFKTLLEKEDNDLFKDLEDPESQGISFSPPQTPPESKEESKGEEKVG